MSLSISSVPLLFSMSVDQLCIEAFLGVPKLGSKLWGNSAKKKGHEKSKQLVQSQHIPAPESYFLLRNWKRRKWISTSEKQHYYSCNREAFLIQNRLQQFKGCCRLHGSLSWKLPGGSSVGSSKATWTWHWAPCSGYPAGSGLSHRDSQVPPSSTSPWFLDQLTTSCTSS